MYYMFHCILKWYLDSLSCIFTRNYGITISYNQTTNFFIPFRPACFSRLHYAALTEIFRAVI